MCLFKQIHFPTSCLKIKDMHNSHKTLKNQNPQILLSSHQMPNFTQIRSRVKTENQKKKQIKELGISPWEERVLFVHGVGEETEKGVRKRSVGLETHLSALRPNPSVDSAEPLGTSPPICQTWLAFFVLGLFLGDSGIRKQSDISQRDCGWFVEGSNSRGGYICSQMWI